VSSDTPETDYYDGRDRCGVTRKKDGDPCRNPAVGAGLPCARHIRERAEAIRLSGGLDLDADVPGSGPGES
jgi:hypothetical protein